MSRLRGVGRSDEALGIEREILLFYPDPQRQPGERTLMNRQYYSTEYGFVHFFICGIRRPCGEKLYRRGKNGRMERQKAER